MIWQKYSVIHILYSFFCAFCVSSPIYPSFYDTSLFDDGNAFLNKGLDPRIFHNLGTFSSRFSPRPIDNRHPPKGCKVVQVTSLERHGARHLSAKAHKSAVETISKLQRTIHSSHIHLSRLPRNLQALAHARIDAGVEDLLPFGALQAWYSGRSSAFIYHHSLKGAFIRSTGNDVAGQDRVLLSSKYWRLGYEGKPFPSRGMMTSKDVRTLANSILPADVIMAENKKTNNTLRPSTCPAETTRTDRLTSSYVQLQYAQNTVLPFVGKRFQDFLAKYGIFVDVTMTILADLANLCLFETFTNAHIGQQGKKLNMEPSSLCQLFDPKCDWPILGYYMDLGMYYQAGYGDPNYRALGMGYVRELLARLTNAKPILDPPASLNTTLAIDPNTFPTNDETLYMDNSRDGTIASIVSTIGFFDGPKLSFDKVHAERYAHRWRFAEIAPMGGKIVFEKINCEQKNDSFVRVWINDVRQSLQHSWCPSFSEKDASQSLCPLATFTKHLDEIQADDAWDKVCYGTLGQEPM